MVILDKNFVELSITNVITRMEDLDDIICCDFTSLNRVEQMNP